MRQRLAVVALPIVLVSLALVVKTIADGALHAFTAYETPFASLGATRAGEAAVRPAAPLSAQVVVVLRWRMPDQRPAFAFYLDALAAAVNHAA